MARFQQGGEFHVTITNSSVQTLVIGNRNTVVNNNYCSRSLEYPKRSTPCRSGAIQDGGQSRGAKRVKQQKLRFPQRKFRADPKKALSESEEETTRPYSPKVFPMISREAEQNAAKSLKKFYLVLNRLHPLRDRGNWKGFDKESEFLQLGNQGDSELQMLLTIEKAVIASYKNDLEQAESMVLEALENLNKTKVTASVSYDFLVCMAYIHLTGFYRRLNKHGEAWRSIAIAEQNFQNVNSRFVKALIFYEMASNHTKYISISPNDAAREKLVSEATDYMKRCISLCIELDDGHVYIKKHHFALVKLALMALNCRTRPARSQKVSSKCIEEAKTCLKTVEVKYKHEMSEAQLIQFLVAKSDLNFRQNNLHDAEVDGLEALHLAEANGFNLEIAGIKQRLDYIASVHSRQTMTLGIRLSQEEYPESLSSSTSPSMKNSPNSSDC